MIVGEREFETDKEEERTELRKQVLTAELPFEGRALDKRIDLLGRKLSPPSLLVCLRDTHSSPVEMRALGPSTTLKCLNIDGSSVASVASVTFDALYLASL